MSIVAVFIVGVSAVAVAQPKPAQRPATLHSVTVFEGNATQRTTKGTTECTSVTVRRWTVTEHQETGHPVPVEGTYLVHLRSGRMKTIVDGVSTVREPNHFWVVKQGSAMRVQVLGQTAVFDTLMAASR